MAPTRKNLMAARALGPLARREARLGTGPQGGDGGASKCPASADIGPGGEFSPLAAKPALMWVFVMSPGQAMHHRRRGEDPDGCRPCGRERAIAISWRDPSTFGTAVNYYIFRLTGPNQE